MDEVQLLTANQAMVREDGLVDASGLGWSGLRLPSPPVALILIIKIPYDQLAMDHQVRIQLRDADHRELDIGMVFELSLGQDGSRPAGAAVDYARVIDVPADLPLLPDSTYEWVVNIDGTEFATRIIHTLSG